MYTYFLFSLLDKPQVGLGGGLNMEERKDLFFPPWFKKYLELLGVTHNKSNVN